MTKFFNFKTSITILFMVLCMFACDRDSGNSVGPVNAKFDRTGRPQKITVITYPNKKELTRAYQKITGQSAPEHDGFAVWSNETEEWGCEIHVVPITGNNNISRMTDWGHELAHCMYGSFHS